MIWPTIRALHPGQSLVCPSADGVSFTANPAGFAPFGAVVSAYGWDARPLVSCADQANSRGEVGVLPELHPKAFLVPRTHGKPAGDFLIRDLISAVDQLHIRKLHFAHFFFISDKLPTADITIILEHLHGRDCPYLQELIFDIDCRFETELRQLQQRIFGSDQ